MEDGAEDVADGPRLAIVPAIAWEPRNEDRPGASSLAGWIVPLWVPAILEVSARFPARPG